MTVSPSDLLPDPDEVSRFLSGVNPIHLFAIQPETKDTCGAYFDGNVRDAQFWALEYSAAGWNVHWTVNAVRPGFTRKPTKAHIVANRFVHVDVDPPKVGDDWDVAKVLSDLLNANPAPSMIVASGNGLQALWALDGAADVAVVEGVNKALINRFGGDTGTWNVDRLLRVPGTINFPDHRKRALGRVPVLARLEQAHTGEIFSIEALQKAFGFAQPVHRDPSSKATKPAKSQCRHFLTANDLGLGPFSPLREIIERPKGEDRSRDTLHFACEMLREDFSDEHIQAILLNPENAISAHCLDQDDPQRAVTRVIAKGRYEVFGEETIENAPGPVPQPTPAIQCPLPAPWPGFMAEAVQLAVDTAHKAQPEMAKLSVLVAMASACSGNVSLPDGMRLNLYGVCTAPTASGKDRLVHAARAISRAAGTKLIGDIGSAAGIEDALSADVGMLSIIDEIAHTLAAREGRGNPFLKGVEQMLLRLYSASNGSYSTRVLAGRDSKIIDHPCLSLLGFAVPSELGEAISDGDAASGLLGRMLIAVGDGNAAPRLDAVSSFALSYEMTRKLETIRQAGRHTATIQIDDDAKEAISAFTLSLHARTISLPEDAIERALWGRTLEKAKRVAGVIAFFDEPREPILRCAHMEWAVSFVEACDTVLLELLREHMHGGVVQADAQKVIRKVASILRGEVKAMRPAEIAAISGGFAPVSVLLRQTRMDSKALNAAIDHLVARGDLVRAPYPHPPTAGAGRGIQAVCFPSE